MSISPTDSERAHMQDRRRECGGGRAGTAVAGGALCSTDLLRVPEQELLHRPQPQGSHCSSEGKPHTENTHAPQDKVLPLKDHRQRRQDREEERERVIRSIQKRRREELDSFSHRRTELPGGRAARRVSTFGVRSIIYLRARVGLRNTTLLFLKVLTCRSVFFFISF